MSVPLDARLYDDIALHEIELTSTLMIAGSQAKQHLTDQEVDMVLGLR